MKIIDKPNEDSRYLRINSKKRFYVYLDVLTRSFPNEKTAPCVKYRPKNKKFKWVWVKK